MNLSLKISVLILTICVVMMGYVSFILGAPQWIQSTERVVGEGSAQYQDVVNRPMKTIWANFTSEHQDGGAHKPGIFPTPLPTATPAATATPQPTPTPLPANNRIDWTSATADFATSGTVNLSSSSAVRPVIIFAGTLPDIPLNSVAFWVDSYTGQTWLVLDQNSLQRKVQLQ